MRKILVVIDSRPEAIKMAPLIHRLRAVPAVQTIVCTTARTSQALARELALFGIQADEDYSQELTPAAAKGGSVTQWIERLIVQHRPDCVLAQGCTVLTSFQQRVSVDCAGVSLSMYELRHRDGDDVPDLVATHYFVSSEAVRAELLGGGVAAENIYLTDSTVVDALQIAARSIQEDAALQARLAADFSFLEPGKRLLLVAGHQHENHGGRLESVCMALRRLAMRPDVQVVYPVPANPRVRSIVDEVFADHPGMVSIELQDFPHFVYLLQAAYLVVTDSRDVQEEAQALGKPVLVTRDVSERPETVDVGGSKLVGADTERILLECVMFLEDPSYYRSFASHAKTYGGGQASLHIAEAMLR